MQEHFSENHVSCFMFMFKNKRPNFLKHILIQIATTESFNDLDPKVRDCLLPHENKKVNLSTLYSKSSCQYECTINFARQKCKCMPWNIPRLPNDNIRFCFSEDDDCFTNAMEAFQPSICNCPSGSALISLYGRKHFNVITLVRSKLITLT